MFDFFKKKPQGQEEPKAEKKEEIETESEYEWLVECFVQFLVSPIWKLNINSFIDENCIFFEDVEENQLEHLKIHKEFIKVADGLLENFMGE